MMTCECKRLERVVEQMSPEDKIFYLRTQKEKFERLIIKEQDKMKAKQ